MLNVVKPAQLEYVGYNVFICPLCRTETSRIAFSEEPENLKVYCPDCDSKCFSVNIPAKEMKEALLSLEEKD